MTNAHAHALPLESLKLVEESTGHGRLEWCAQTFSGVAYRIRRLQAMTASGLPVPGLHRIEGEIDLESIPEPGRLVDGDLTLWLEDGRSVRVVLADDRGRVLAVGHGPSRCSCC
jgi:hypothetical protein